MVKPRAECLFHQQQSGQLDAYSDADGEVDKVTRRSVSVGVIMRGGHCLKVWTKKQQVVFLFTAECEPIVHRSQYRARVIGNSERGEGFELACGLNLHMDATATMCLVSRRGLGKAKHVDMQNL